MFRGRVWSFAEVQAVNGTDEKTEEAPPVDLCNPSPCGQNGTCKVVADIPTCSAVPGHTGVPCRKEFCWDPDCRNSPVCGDNTYCLSFSDHAMCACVVGTRKDEYTRECTSYWPNLDDRHTIYREP